MAEFKSKKVFLSSRDGRPAVEVELRTCYPEDAESYLPFWQAVASETTYTLQRLADGLPDVEKVRDNWRRTLEDLRALKIGVFVGDVLIAQLGIYTGTPHAWTRHIATFGMMIRQEHWGRGIGGLLLDELEKYARLIGITKIEAQVRVSNERAWQLYRRHGYQIEGQRKKAANIEGRYEDEYWIAKELPAGLQVV